MMADPVLVLDLRSIWPRWSLPNLVTLVMLTFTPCDVSAKQTLDKCGLNLLRSYNQGTNQIRSY